MAPGQGLGHVPAAGPRAGDRRRARRRPGTGGSIVGHSGGGRARRPQPFQMQDGSTERPALRRRGADLHHQRGGDARSGRRHRHRHAQRRRRLPRAAALPGRRATWSPSKSSASAASRTRLPTPTARCPRGRRRRVSWPSRPGPYPPTDSARPPRSAGRALPRTWHNRRVGSDSRRTAASGTDAGRGSKAVIAAATSVDIRIPKTMRALVKARPEAGAELREVPVPHPGPGEVLIRLEAVSLCGTDLHIYRWDPWARRTAGRQAAPDLRSRDGRACGGARAGHGRRPAGDARRRRDPPRRLDVLPVPDRPRARLRQPSDPGR